MSLRPKIKINCLLLLLACYVVPVMAQPKFKFKSALPKVDSNRFYSIELQPGLTAKCQPGLQDIRLTDEKGTPVPYLLGGALPVKTQSSYRQLPWVSTGFAKDSLTAYIAENRDHLSINQLWITIRNTAVNRTVNVLGSDDLQHWFAIKENLVLQEAASDKTGTFQELLTFPASNYRYFKIQVNDAKLAPINMLQAGVYQSLQAKTAYMPVPVVRFTSTNQHDTSLINVAFKDAYRVNKLHLQFAGTKYYRRRVLVYQLIGKNLEWLQDAYISSDDSGDLYLSAKANRLRLLIHNEDNPPLVVQSVLAYQVRQSLVAYLEKQHQYQLSFGDEKAAAPRFDLQFFTDSITQRLPVISHANITTIRHAEPKQKADGIPVWVMWVAGGVALLILLTLTLKMMKEVGKSNPS